MAGFPKNAGIGDRITANQFQETGLAGTVLAAQRQPVPLFQGKAYIRWDDGETEPLLQNDDYQAELENVFSVSKYPSAMSWGDTADQKVKQYKMDLECATDVGCRGVSSEQAWDAYRELRYNRTV